MRATLRAGLERPWLTLGALVAVAVALLPTVYLAFRLAEAGVGRVVDEVLTPRALVLAGRSLALTAVVTAACLVIGVGLAWLVTRTRLPGRRLWAVLAALPLAVPSYVAAYAWLAVGDAVGGPRFEGFWAAAVVLTLYTYPYLFLPVATALASADPAQEEVARTLGYRPWAVFAQVTWPQLRPAVVAGGLLCALYVLADFGAVSILRVDTFTRAIFTSFSVGFDRTGAVALSGVLLALTFVLIGLGAGRADEKARYHRSSTARRVARLPLRRWTAPAVAAASGVAVAALGVPATALALWFVQGVSRPGAVTQIVAAGAASVGVSALGALVTTALALPLALLAAQAPSALSRHLERAAYLAHALPGVVVGLSLVFVGINVLHVLYQTVWLLALAYATLFLPLAAGAIATAARRAPRGIDEVARSLGTTPRGVFTRITLPLTLPGLGAGAALVWLTAMKELPATLMLRPTGMETLATRLWTHTSVDAYAAAAPYAALLVGLAAIPTWVLVARSGVLGGRT